LPGAPVSNAIAVPVDVMLVGQGLHAPALFAEANRSAVRQQGLGGCAMMHDDFHCKETTSCLNGR